MYIIYTWNIIRQQVFDLHIHLKIIYTFERSNMSLLRILSSDLMSIKNRRERNI